MLNVFIRSLRCFPQRFETVCISVLNNLRKLNEDIFACLVQPAYEDNIYLFERRIHLAKEKVLRLFVLLNAINKTELEKQITAKLNRLYDAMMGYAQLRNRLTDYSVLSVCQDEVAHVEKVIDQLLIIARTSLIKHQYAVDVHPLSSAIQQLETNYQQVLQVAAKEPLVFLLFIASLQLFCEELANID